jgi:hypothetical protein
MGQGFQIARIYASVAALQADATAPTNIACGEFALINTNNVDDEENARLYMWNGTTYVYMLDLSGQHGIQGIQGVPGIQGVAGPKGANGSTTAQESVFYWSEARTILTSSKFDEVAFEKGPIGPPGSTWAAVAGSNCTAFTSTQSGSYEIKYKIDLDTGDSGNTLNAATVLTLNGVQVDGSCTGVEAPHTNHVYTVPNTILVNYVAGQQLSLLVWVSDVKNNVAIGAPAEIVGKLPSGASVKEATASLVITRIQ